MEGKPQINHIDGNRQNCRVENLEWVTRSENRKYAYKMGLAKSGVEHYESRLTVEQVRYIRKVYKKGDKNFGGVALARKFNMSKNAVHNVVKGKTYKNIYQSRRNSISRIFAFEI